MALWQNCFQSACAPEEVPDIRVDQDYLVKKPSLEIQFGVLRPLVRIPMMSISHSDLMPISSERSDAEPSQCETVIDMSQDFVCIS